MNKIAYKDKTEDIDGFAEVLEDDRKNFMWPILELVDKAYEVTSVFFGFWTLIQIDFFA